MNVRLPGVTAFVSLLCCVTPALSTPAHWHRNLAFAPSARPAHQVARRALEAHPARFGLARVSLAPNERVIRWRDQAVVRIGQEYEGLPVFGRGLAARVDASGRLRTVRTNVAKELDLVTDPVITQGEAFFEASLHWGRPLRWPAITLGVLDDGRQGVLVFRVEGSLSVHRVQAMVDAVTGEVLRHASLTRYEAWAQVYPENPSSTPTLTLMELLHLTQDATQLNGRFGSVWRYISGELNPQGSQLSDLTVEQTATLDGTMFDDAPTLDASQPDFHDGFAEVSAYYHTDRIDAYFRDVHGYSTARRYEVVVNYGEGEETIYENAFFTPLGTTAYGLFLGQWQDLDTAYDSDVIYHEYGHSVVEDLTGMEYAQFFAADNYGQNPMPGAIHEGMADYFSSTVTGDSLLGEYSLGHYARDLDNTYVCPGDLQGEAHADGELVGGTTWAIRAAIGPALADDIIYGGLAVQPPNATFRDLAQGILDAAAALVTATTMTQTQYDQVEAILESRGFVACDRSLPMDDGAAYAINSPGFELMAQAMGQTCVEMRDYGIWMPGYFQYRIDVPVDAQTLTIRVEHDPGDGDMLWHAYVRSGEMVWFDLIPAFGGYFYVPEVSMYNHHFGYFQSGGETLVIDVASRPPLQPGTTYYLAFTHQNCPTNVTTVTAETSTEGPQVDAGVDGGTADATPGDTDPKGGCSCSQPGSGGLLWLLFPGIALLFTWRRRRR